MKPKIFKSVSEYLSNESEKSNFHSGKQKLWPNEFSERSLWNLYSPWKWPFCIRPRNSTKPLLLDPGCQTIARFHISWFLKLVCERGKGKCDWSTSVKIGRENGLFANDLGIRRNHFFWIRDVKLLLGFKFQNFWS